MKNEEYWNKRAASYDDQVMGEYADANEQTVLRSLAYCKDTDEMLEIACGTGVMTLGIANHVGHITAVDISSAMLCRLREKAQGRCDNLTLIHSDIFDHKFDDKHFDVIAAYNVLLYMENIDEVLERIHSLLKPGGMFLSATDCVGGLDNADAEEKRKRVENGELSFVGFFTPEELAETIEKAGFTVLESENIHEGTPNQFIAARRF
ncbi:MAG: methyltransferase domain-containing protein [Mogibacterium sp.]|nr:methyltransferase domain-containing protein [Mogibacterium sp.]